MTTLWNVLFKNAVVPDAPRTRGNRISVENDIVSFADIHERTLDVLRTTGGWLSANDVSDEFGFYATMKQIRFALTNLVRKGLAELSIIEDENKKAVNVYSFKEQSC